jgi:hypothetical protein
MYLNGEDMLFASADELAELLIARADRPDRMITVAARQGDPALLVVELSRAVPIKASEERGAAPLSAPDGNSRKNSEDKHKSPTAPAARTLVTCRRQAAPYTAPTRVRWASESVVLGVALELADRQPSATRTSARLGQLRFPNGAIPPS